ncbi:MAG TPA: sigma-70 family RNA polymerase sigma factor [Acidimicrobiales bacterium]|nr:sigma-70 family RNA polymerase sigma factor [Acidimicrobiales bacterium]
MLRSSWGAAVAHVARVVGDLGLAEDAVQEACAVAVERWPRDGVPADPRAWLVGTARHKAIDRLRRESRRAGKEEAAARWTGTIPAPPDDPAPLDPAGLDDEELGLVFGCCHPALAPEVRVALALRSVCGLTTAEVAARLLVAEPAMAKRLTRARAKLRDAAVPLRLPGPDDLPDRLPSVLRVLYLVFTEGHHASSGDALVRPELCDDAIRLTRSLVRRLPGEPEAGGLLALLLLTDARRAARTDAAGDVVLLEDQDRRLWDRDEIAEGDAVLERALRANRPGSYQLQAAIASCHADAGSAADTDWRQIALLYGELVRYEPTPVVEANRAVAVAMSEGPAAGLVILDAVALHPRLAGWVPVHLARADLLARLDRTADAVAAYEHALTLGPSAPERRLIARRLGELRG